MSYFMNPGGVNQISSFRSENLPCNWRPEAHNEESSPVSGACLCLLKKLWDLSRSSPLCQHDKLSFQASRWPFVCDDLLIFFSPPLAWLFILLIAVVLPSSSPGEKVGRTAAASKELKKKKNPKRTRERKEGGWMGGKKEFSTFDCLLHCWFFVVEEEPFWKIFSAVVFLCDKYTEDIQVYNRGEIHTWASQETHRQKRTSIQTLNYYGASIPCSKKA